MKIADKKLFTAGLACTAFIFLLDQLTKWIMLDQIGIAHRPPIEITGFFNLVMVWNYGISFGMFSGYNVPLILIVVTGAISLVLLFWLMRNRDRATALGISLVLGGALGNIVDRVRFGAVADFLDFHLAGYHWPAFNVADATIFIGVVVLCIQSMMSPHKKPE